jgi:hypothetical protein
MAARRPEVRASDREREVVADALRSHCAAGRLQVDELEQRLGAALSAATVAELEHLLRDLPGGVPAPRSAQKKIKPGLPGLRTFRQEHELPSDCELAFREALQDILPVMVGAGYGVICCVDNELLVFERHDERVVMSFNASTNGGTRLVVQGTARWRVRKAFANLAAH